jgi:type II secretory pathway pseudopilin PulG
MSFPGADGEMEMIGMTNDEFRITSERQVFAGDRGAHAPSRACFDAPPKRPSGKKFAIARARPPAREARALPRMRAFTLIELLVVISIIIVLMGLLFPAFRGVQDQAKKTQAKNDLTQIVTAVNAYYAEYGKYPITAQGSDTILPGDEAQENLMDTLRASGGSLNPRGIVFLSPPTVKDNSNPRSGMGTDRKFYDPWGTAYFVAIDGDYDNVIAASKPAYADLTDPIRSGVISWSYGKDQTKGTKNPSSSNFKTSDDVVSWQ